MRVYKNIFFLMFIVNILNAQILEPRLYSNAPIGMNFLIVGTGQSQGALETSPELELENENLKVNAIVLAYAKAFDLFGKSAKVDFILPLSNIDGTAEQNGVQLNRDVRGVGDIKARVSVNILGSPALSLKDFMQYKQDIIVGLSLQVTAPTGQFDDTKLINIGTNRWSVKPGIGISKAFGNTVLELSADAEFYSTNDEFIYGKMKRDPVYSVQAHIVYSMKNKMWFALGANYYEGGETTIKGIANDNALSNSRLGAVFALPIDKKNSIKIVGSTGVSTRTGTDFNSILVAWQYRWGAGL